eukprot:scaffold4.g4998.t1
MSGPDSDRPGKDDAATAGFKEPLPRKPAPPKFGEVPISDAEAIGGEQQPPAAYPMDAEDDASKQRREPPPPPKFAALPARPTAAGADATRAAAMAAARAAQHATPAQRERMVMEAAANALAEQQARDAAAAEAAAGQGAAPPPAEQRKGPGAAAPAPAAPRPPGAYAPPDWGGEPRGVPYQMEVMKGGAIIATLDLSKQGHYTLHAVVQFRGEDGTAFLFDPGSTHGVFRNKERIPAHKHMPLRVGDVVKFGESTRLYLLGGPQELMPDEGPSRQQRCQLAALDAMQARPPPFCRCHRACRRLLPWPPGRPTAARKLREEAKAKAQMEAALGRSDGASWGFGEDAEMEEDEAGEVVDWRAYAATRGLTEKQQKLAEKIKKRELRAQHLQRENEKIRGKEKSMEDLTAGQASTLVRNERVIDESLAEIEELEEQLCDSIRDALGQKRKAAEAKGGAKKRRRRPDSDEEYAGSSDEDSFYDRTGKPSGARRGAGAGAPGGRRGTAQEVEDAASLYGRKEALLEERKKLEERLAQEEAAAAVLACGGPAGVRGAGEQGGGQEGEQDALDAFMSGVEVQLESDKVASLKREIAEVDAQVARAEHLLRIADPDGYFKPGSKAAMAAVDKAKRKLEVDKQRKAAEERQRQQREAARKAEAEAAAFVPETEEEEESAPGAQQQQRQAAPASLHKLEAPDQQAGGLEVRRKPAAPPAGTLAGAGAEAQAAPAAPAQQPQLQQQLQAAGGVSSYEARRKTIAAALAAQKAGAAPTAAPAAVAAQGEPQDAASKVLADLALLSRARRGYGAEQQEEDEAAAGAQARGEGGDVQQQGQEEDAEATARRHARNEAAQAALAAKLGY